MSKYSLTPSDKIRIARQRRQRQRAQDARVTAIVQGRLDRDLDHMMRNNRSAKGGI